MNSVRIAAFLKWALLYFFIFLKKESKVPEQTDFNRLHGFKSFDCLDPTNITKCCVLSLVISVRSLLQLYSVCACSWGVFLQFCLLQVKCSLNVKFRSGQWHGHIRTFHNFAIERYASGHCLSTLNSCPKRLAGSEQLIFSGKPY